MARKNENEPVGRPLPGTGILLWRRLGAGGSHHTFDVLQPGCDCVGNGCLRRRRL